MKKVTAAIIINEHNKILIAQRSSKDKLALKWEFPGGKIMEGETPEACLKREIMEELNMDVNVGSYFTTSIYQYETGCVELLAYYAKPSDTAFKLVVHNDARWVDISEITSFDFAPADIPIMRKLVRDRMKYANPGQNTLFFS